MKIKKEKIIIGWREWCALPELGISAIKFKTDTGAGTSSLHAMHIKPFKKQGKEFIQFETHPIQRNNHLTIRCQAEIIGHKHVRSSNGTGEERWVIKTPIQIGKQKWPIKLTLTSREEMGFRMLLGREAMHDYMIIDPHKSYYLGELTETQIKDLYR